MAKRWLACFTCNKILKDEIEAYKHEFEGHDVYVMKIHKLRTPYPKRRLVKLLLLYNKKR